MNCDEIQQLLGTYLDSELDARTTLDFQQHVAGCPNCAVRVAAETSLNARMVAKLKQEQRTPALWAKLEQQVIRAAPASRSQPAAEADQPKSWWRELLWPCPQAWAGLAAVWVAILVTHAVSNPEPQVAVHNAVPLAPDVKLALKQQGQLLAELIDAPETAPAAKPRSPVVSPRSERGSKLLNT
jgi:anti-sigma factor RsiW